MVSQHCVSWPRVYPAARDSMNAYREYLRLDALLDCQSPRTPRQSTDLYCSEHFFIICHQACELWFKQMLEDIHAAVGCLATTPPCLNTAKGHLTRVCMGQQAVCGQMFFLSQLPRGHFHSFRPMLGSASGIQSWQYREVQRVLGLRPVSAGLLLTAYCSALAYHQMELEDIDADHPSGVPLTDIAELLIDISLGMQRMQFAHMQLAEKLIGNSTGSGGTSGVSYLRKQLRRRAFEALWGARVESDEI